MKNNSKNPLISVIVPIYKIEDYLAECVDSIIAQSYSNLEIILVDDESPDGCPAICDDYKKKDKRIRVIHKKNGGLSDARNAGLGIATGQYVCFIDGDDYIDRDFVKDLFDALVNNDADMSICGYQLLNPDGKLEVAEKPKDEVLDEDGCWARYFGGLGVTVVVAWNKLYKLELFKEVKYTKGKINEDEIILHELLSRCKKVAIISRALYYYRQRSNSITGGKHEIISDDAFGGLFARAEYFLNEKKYAFCARQISSLIGETKNRELAKKNRGRLLKFVKRIPKKYISKKIRLKIFTFKYLPFLYRAKWFRGLYGAVRNKKKTAKE